MFGKHVFYFLIQYNKQYNNNIVKSASWLQGEFSSEFNQTHTNLCLSG